MRPGRWSYYVPKSRCVLLWLVIFSVKDCYDMSPISSGRHRTCWWISKESEGMRNYCPLLVGLVQRSTHLLFNHPILNKWPGFRYANPQALPSGLKYEKKLIITAASMRRTEPVDAPILGNVETVLNSQEHAIEMIPIQSRNKCKQKKQNKIIITTRHAILIHVLVLIDQYDVYIYNYIYIHINDDHPR